MFVKLSTMHFRSRFQTNMFKESNPSSYNLPNLFHLSKAVEVLLRCRAFVVKRTCDDNPESRRGQVTWSKFPTVADAWGEAKRRSGF